MNKLLEEIASNYIGFGRNGFTISYENDRNNLNFSNERIHFWPKKYKMTLEEIDPIIKKFLKDRGIL